MSEEYYDKKLARSGKEYKRCFFAFVGACIALLVFFLFSSCKSTKYIEVPVEHIVIKEKTDTILSKDSIWLHDSVYIHSKGDTVYFEKWHTKYRDKIEYKVRIDSFVKVDSVAVPYPVERKLSKWEQAKIDFGGWSLFIIFIILVFIILRPRRVT